MTGRRIAAGSLVAATATAVLAGESALEPPDLERYLRWGPLRARPGFELVNAGYDDNILSSSTEVIPDYTATLFAKLDGLVLFGSRAFLVFDERLGYQGYLENPDQGFPLQRGNARLTLPSQRLGLFVEGRLVRDSESPVDRLDVRPDRAEDALGTGVILEPGWRTSLELSAAARRWRHSDPDFTNLGGETVDERLDRDERFLRLKARYHWYGRTSLTVDAHQGEIDFVYPDPFGLDKDSDTWRARAGVQLEAGGPLTGWLRLGWERIDAIEPVLVDFDGVVGEIELAWRPLSRTTLLLRGQREPGFGITTGSTYYLDTHADLSVVYYLNRIFGVEVGGGLGTLTFPGGIPANRRDETEVGRLALRFRLAENSIGRRVEYRIELQGYERDSSIPSASVSRTTLGVSAAVGF
jgi:hypothetical protein